MADDNVGGAGPGDAPTGRATAIAAERERRRRQQQARAEEEAAAGVDGFGVRRWRRAGVYGADAVTRIGALLHTLLARCDGANVSAADTDVLRDALDGSPTPAVPAAVRALLEQAPADVAVDALTTIHQSGTAWLADWAQRRLALLTSPQDDAGDRPVPGLGDAEPDPSADSSGAFTAYRHAAAGTLADLGQRQLRRLLPWVSLAVLDDLIDAGALRRRHRPWYLREDTTEQNHLRARLWPEQVSAEEARQLDWPEWHQRSRFLAGENVDADEGSLYDLLASVGEGDVAAAKELERLLPRELVLRVRRVFDGAQIGSWDADIIADRGLWSLIAALWEPKAAVDPSRSRLHALIALRNAYDLIVARQPKKAADQLERLLVAGVLTDRRAVAEARNMDAYLHFLNEDLESAAASLARIPPESARHNVALVERRAQITRNNRSHPSNPYLELGLPPFSPVAETRWRQLRLEFQDDKREMARINRAVTRIREAERQEDWSDFFAIPLNGEVFAVPCAVPVSLVPTPGPMPRTTPPGTAFRELRDRAILDLVPGVLTAPRHPEHQVRTAR